MTQFIVGVVVVVYVLGIVKFLRGFTRTNFNRSLPNKLILSLLWPVLLVNGSYRKNFQKALKG